MERLERGHDHGLVGRPISNKEAVMLSETKTKIQDLKRRYDALRGHL